MILLDVQGKTYVLFGYDLDFDEQDQPTEIQKAVYYYVILNSLIVYFIPVTPSLTEIIIKKFLQKVKTHNNLAETTRATEQQLRTEYDIGYVSPTVSTSQPCSMSKSNHLSIDLVKFVLEQRETAWNVYKRAVSGIIFSIKDTIKNNMLGSISDRITREILDELIKSWLKICEIDNLVGIGFAIPSSGVTPSVSYTNQYMNSPVEDAIKDLAKKLGSLRWINLAQKAVQTGKMYSATGTRTVASKAVDLLSKIFAGGAYLFGADSQAVENTAKLLGSVFIDLLFGATISLPKVWADFSITMSHSISINLAASNIKQYVRNVLLPYIMILPFTVPLTGNIINESSMSSYYLTVGLTSSQPLPAFVTCPGVFTVPLGIVFNLTRNVQTETVDMYGKPLRMDIQLTINDSIESLMIPEASLWRQHRIFVMPQIGYALWGDVQVDPVREFLYEYLQSIQPNLAVNTTYHKIPTPMQPTTDVNKQLLEHNDKVIFGA